MIADRNERKRLNLLEILKVEGGPFTSSEEVNNYISRDDLSTSDEKPRLKNEVKFARDSSVSLPRVDTLFKMQTEGWVEEEQKR